MGRQMWPRWPRACSRKRRRPSSRVRHWVAKRLPQGGPHEGQKKNDVKDDEGNSAVVEEGLPHHLGPQRFAPIAEIVIHHSPASESGAKGVIVGCIVNDVVDESAAVCVEDGLGIGGTSVRNRSTVDCPPMLNAAVAPMRDNAGGNAAQQAGLFRTGAAIEEDKHQRDGGNSGDNEIVAHLADEDAE